MAFVSLLRSGLRSERESIEQGGQALYERAQDPPQQPAREQDQQDPVAVRLHERSVAVRDRGAASPSRTTDEPSSGGSGTRLNSASTTFIWTPVLSSAITGSLSRAPERRPTNSAGREQQRQQQVRQRPGSRDEHVAARRAAEVAAVDRGRLRPAEQRHAAPEDLQQRDQDGADRVDVGERVERDPALRARRCRPPSAAPVQAWADSWTLSEKSSTTK